MASSPGSLSKDLGLGCYLKAPAQAALLWASIPLGKGSWWSQQCSADWGAGLGGCLTVENTVGRDSVEQNQVNFPVCSVGAFGATLGTVRFVAVFSISEICR